MAAKKAASKKKAASASSGKKLLSSDPTLTDQERQALEAVRQFEISEKTIQIFKDDNQQLMAEYDALIEERNQKLEVADQLVRGLDVSCGPWDRYTASVRYNADALFQHLGRTQFLNVGGSINTQTVYDLDKERVEIAIQTGAIPANVVPAFKTESPSYHAPKKKT
jgi:hypothetical protein